ncbi:MAG: GC-type dockerin domain-anchored protein [Planctomycetota bacterium]
MHRPTRRPRAFSLPVIAGLAAGLGAGAMTPTAQAQSLEGDIVWPAGSVQELSNPIIDGTLTIEAGVIVRIASGGSLRILEEGSITVLGTAEEPVVFESQGQGWFGIELRNGVQGEFRHAHITEVAGTALLIASENSIRFVDSSVRDNTPGFGRFTAINLSGDSSLVMIGSTIGPLVGQHGSDSPNGTNGFSYVGQTADDGDTGRNGGNGGNALRAGDGEDLIGLRGSISSRIVVLGSTFGPMTAGNGGDGGDGGRAAGGFSVNNGGAGGRGVTGVVGGDGGVGGNGGFGNSGGNAGDGGEARAIRIDAEFISPPRLINNTFLLVTAGEDGVAGARTSGGPRGPGGSAGQGLISDGDSGPNGSNGSAGSDGVPGDPGDGSMVFLEVFGATTPGLVSANNIYAAVDAPGNASAFEVSMFAPIDIDSTGDLVAEDDVLLIGPGTIASVTRANPRLNATTLVPRDSSAAIDLGDASLLPMDTEDIDGDGDAGEPLPLDFLGGARVRGASVDAGAVETVPACEPDLAAPFGVLDVFDVIEFLGRFDAQDPAADLASPSGTFDIFDVLGYLAAFDLGCD